MQSYLADLVPSVFGSLNENGYFYDPVERGKGLLSLFSIFFFWGGGGEQLVVGRHTVEFKLYS